MPLKTISVFIEPTSSGEARIAYAARLAWRHRAHLVGVFVVPSLMGGSTAESFVMGHQAVRDVIAQHRAREAEAVGQAKQGFAAICAREGIGFEFRSVSQGDLNDEVVLNSLHADLVIAGEQPGGGGLPSEWSAEALLLASGVPLLLLPESWSGSPAEHIVVAWNASREARRAIADALPLLVAAISVIVLLVDPEKNPRHGQQPGADIAHFLSRHGVNVSVEQLHSNGAPVAKVLLDHARQRGADLLVIGAYSHARTTQMIFGGVTRSLLCETDVPLLIAH